MRTHRFLIPCILALAFVASASLANASEGHAVATPSAVAGGHDETATDPGLRSPDLAPGESWSHTFTATGKLDYHCHPHPWMLASITIQASSGRAPMNHTINIIEPEGQDFDKWTWSPAITTIEVGDTVTWINKGSVVHIVQETTAEHAEHIGSATGADEAGHDVAASGGGHGGHDGGVFGILGQSWLWIGLALLGGIAIGRRAARLNPKEVPLPAAELPTASPPAAQTASAPSAPVVPAPAPSSPALDPATSQPVEPSERQP